MAAQTRQGAPALIRTMQNDKCRARAKSGPLMAIMTLLRPGGTAQGLGGDSDGVNGSYELVYTCGSPPGGLALADQTGEYAHHPSR